MSVRTKKPPTDPQCTLAFMGPLAHADAARAALAALGFTEADSAVLGQMKNILSCKEHRSPVEEVSPSVPWREAFLPLDDADRPGRMLRAARTREDVTQMQLARLTGIPQRHLSEMEHGKRTIGKERAKKLAEALKVDYHVFL